jgi:hypothetical protein
MTLSVTPDYKVAMRFGLVKFSPLPGLTAGGGFGVATDLPNLMAPSGGGPLAPYKSLPTPALPGPPAGAAAFITMDFTKIDALRPIIDRLVLDFGYQR